MNLECLASFSWNELDKELLAYHTAAMLTYVPTSLLTNNLVSGVAVGILGNPLESSDSR